MRRDPLVKAPEDVGRLIAEAEKRTGLPANILTSILTQEGGAPFLADPTRYHYPKGEDGKRRTKDGTVSSAFGPFGILADSTAKDPGYGVKPLASQDLSEQIRFAADYLSARVKQAGSLHKGLALYGQGDQYAAEVLARAGAQDAAIAPAAAAGAPSSGVTGQTAVAAAPVLEGSGAIPLPPELLAHRTTKAAPAQPGADEWARFLSTMPKSAGRPMLSDDFAFGTAALTRPVFNVAPMQNATPNFAAFSGYGKRRA